MSVAIITGSAGLIGSEAAVHFVDRGFDVIGIDNDMRRVFFGPDASTAWNRRRLESTLKPHYRHFDLDIRDARGIDQVFAHHGRATSLVIHAAAQPSHDWAARDPETDFSVNAVGTLNLLQSTLRHCPEAAFIFTSTNKVYGDRPNQFPFVEMGTRWELPEGHTYYSGIREDLSIDQTLHSLFGASKVAADVLVQEYGRYFGLLTACFRGGCMTGPNHAGTELHGFLSYVMKCTMTGRPYTVLGYGGKQVRDNIHATDLISAFDAFQEAPRAGEAYNIGGGRSSNCSMQEAIDHCEEIVGRPLQRTYEDTPRVGDHIWWIGDTTRFQSQYPQWQITRDVPAILREIYEANLDRWVEGSERVGS